MQTFQDGHAIHVKRVACIGAGYVGGPAMAILAYKVRRFVARQLPDQLDPGVVCSTRRRERRGTRGVRFLAQRCQGRGQGQGGGRGQGSHFSLQAHPAISEWVLVRAVVGPTTTCRLLAGAVMKMPPRCCHRYCAAPHTPAVLLPASSTPHVRSPRSARTSR